MEGSETEEELPKTCPFMKECKEKMLFSSFKSRCNSNVWIYCSDKRVQKYRQEKEKTPSAWKLVFELEK